DPPTYVLGHIKLYSFVTLKAAILSIQHGNIESSIKAYANCGLLFSLLKKQYQRGYEFAEMAWNLSYHLESKAQRCKAGLLLAAWLRVWAKPIAGAAQLNYDSFLSGVEAGEVQFADYNLFGNIFNRLFEGDELGSIAKDVKTYKLIAQKNKDELLMSAMAAAQIFAHKLGRSSDKQDGYLLSELEKFMQESEAAQIMLSACLHHILSIHFYYLMEVNDQAMQYVQKATASLSAVAGFTTSSSYYYYSSLVLLRQYPHLSSKEQADADAQIQANQENLKEWSKSCNENFLHKYLLVEAELAHCQNRRADAIELYDQAILEAKENRYCQEEALANELAAKFYLGWGKESIAASYLQDAYYGYARWGAKAKTDDLEQRYSHLLEPILVNSAKHTGHSFNPLATIAAFVTPSVTIHGGEHAHGATSKSSTAGVNGILDFATVIKAAQAISGQMELDQLLTQLIELILRQSGGDHCAIILPDREQTWQLRALATPGNIDLRSEPLESNARLPIKLLHYVKNTQEAVVINNLQTDLPVIDEYLNRSQPRSLLCLPLVSQGKLIGLLTLQNQSTSEVFTQESILILDFICTQAAISLENAKLYEQSQAYAQQIEESQLQTVQNEKMASLGNLVAGVAHEINNPIGFLNGSVRNAQNYLQDLLEHVAIYQKQAPQLPAIEEHAEDIDIEFLCEDFPKLLASMQSANNRIKEISNSLRTFSRADTEHKVSANLHEGLDSTLLILKYRLKANDYRPAIQVIKNYGELSAIDCFPGQLNQVFMNLLANAIDVFDEAAQNLPMATLKANPQVITITTSLMRNDHVEISIRDNGKGMTPEIKAKVFDHLFTTKAVGKGTGLGLAIAHQIITEAHSGRIIVNSETGKGTEFCIQLPTAEPKTTVSMSSKA
ncbi:MAG: ATP-binding protein, partial [Cyanobacteria bacterium J06632_3]